MRAFVRASLLLVGLGFAMPAVGQHDFDPAGRRRRGPSTNRATGTAPSRRRDDGRTKPGTDALIERYSKALVASPTSLFPLQKLTELFRARDGNLDRLVDTFEARVVAAPADERLSTRLALAAIQIAARRRDDAIRELDAIAAAEPNLPAPLLMRAAIAERDGDREVARAQMERALPLVHDAVERERLLRRLMILALDANDSAGASQRHEELVRAAGGSLFVQRELAAELMSRGRAAEAEPGFRAVVRAATGDPRALAPALKDLGEVLARQKKYEEALTVLERARQVAGGQGGVRNGILALLTDIHREQGRLTDLIERLEKEGPRDAASVAAVAALLEETGQVPRAIQRFRDAARLDPQNVELRVHLVHLLQAAGQLDEAIREFEALLKVAPERSEFVFELAETWMQRGERDKALRTVGELERRAAGKADVLAGVADFYERHEATDRALKAYERLAMLPDGEPRILAELGDRYFQSGDRTRAMATWKRMPVVAPSRAEGLEALGEVLLEHDMAAEALDSLREAVQAATPARRARYRKSLASALERVGGASIASQDKYREALRLWQELLDEAGDDAALARDCRNHLVGIWALLRELEARLPSLRASFEGSPPNLESGRLLAEVQRRLGRLGDAEATLRKLLRRATGDASSMMALERVLVLQRNLPAAMEVLARLVEADPTHAREHYQRMSQYAAELYRDDDAVEYASRALELSPEDAEGHLRLAAMHRRRLRVDRAIGELRKALAKNPKLHRAMFELAELVVASGDVDEADRLYRNIVRSARDEEHVVRAARLSMQIHLARGTLEVLEHELLPVALASPQKVVYRRLLVELYANLTAPLIQATRHGPESSAQRAREALRAIGARATKPLLDALLDDGAAQQRVAIDILAYVENRGAGPALFNFATGRGDVELRARAMVACGALSDPALLPRYRDWLVPRDGGPGASEGDPVAVAAAWAVARTGGPDATPILVRLLESPAPEVRSLAAIGLGLSGDRRHAALLSALTRAPEGGPVVRAAAVVAIGELGDPAHRSTLRALAESTESDVQRAALIALARLALPARAKGRNAVAVPARTLDPDLADLYARALWSADARVRFTARVAMTSLHLGEFRRRGHPLPVLDGALGVDVVLEQLAPRGVSRSESTLALASVADALASAAAATVATSPEGARIVASALVGGLAPLLEGASGGTESSEDQAPLVRLREAVAAASLPRFVALARHPSLELRRIAVEQLAGRPEASAREALVAALDPRDPEVCRAALAGLRAPEGEDLLQAIVVLLERGADWSLRALAAEALGRTTTREGASAERLDSTLAEAAARDPIALVREASFRAAVARNPTAAERLARRLGERDEEVRIRTIANDFLRARGEVRRSP